MSGKDDKRPDRARKAGDRAKSSGLTHAEAALWAKVKAGARPLEPGKRTRPSQTEAGDPEEVRARSATPAKGPSPTKPSPPAEAVPVPRPGFGLDRRLEMRLRRGQLPIDARLDLHGMTQAEAHRALADFIAISHDAGRRCVLVITGKGGRAEDVSTTQRTGVLRQAVPQWLSGPPNAALVLATAPARPKDGGAGALYVLLRRRR